MIFLQDCNFGTQISKMTNTVTLQFSAKREKTQLVYHSVKRFCPDFCQVNFNVQLLINLSYDRTVIYNRSHRECIQDLNPIREVSSFVVYRLQWNWDMKMCPY